MNLEIQGNIKLDVNVNPIDVIIELEKNLGFTNAVIKDDKLYSETDVSRQVHRHMCIV